MRKITDFTLWVEVNPYTAEETERHYFVLDADGFCDEVMREEYETLIGEVRRNEALLPGPTGHG